MSLSQSFCLISSHKTRLHSVEIKTLKSNYTNLCDILCVNYGIFAGKKRNSDGRYHTNIHIYIYAYSHLEPTDFKWKPEQILLRIRSWLMFLNSNCAAPFLASLLHYFACSLIETSSISISRKSQDFYLFLKHWLLIYVHVHQFYHWNLSCLTLHEHRSVLNFKNAGIAWYW